MFNLKPKIMKTLKKRRQKKLIKGFRVIKAKDLQQIIGGTGDPTLQDIVFPR
jgi:bacteriocin-like protein